LVDRGREIPGDPEYPFYDAAERIEEQRVFEVIRSGAIKTPRKIGLIGKRESGMEFAGEDLPCPWCHADTTEGDPRCPTCGRRFG
jgi:hypothetical protein